MATITHTHVLAMARNTTTGQTVKEQDLTGHRYLNNLKQRDWCQQAADKLAARYVADAGGISYAVLTRTIADWQSVEAAAAVASAAVSLGPPLAG